MNKARGRGRMFVFLWACSLVLLSSGTAQEAKRVEPAGTTTGKDSVRTLAERLRALEQENRRLMEAGARLAAGRPVESSEVLRDRLPPLPLQTGPGEAGDVTVITEAAAGVVEEMLGKNRIETEKLLGLRRQLERGDAVTLPDVENPEAVGLAARKRVLQAAKVELAAFRARLEALEEEARFREAARIDSKKPVGPQTGTEPGTGSLSTAAGGMDDPSALAAGDEGKKEDPDSTAAATPGMELVADRTALAFSYYRTGRYEDALTVFRSIDPASRPEGPWILYMIGRTLERLGRLDAAEQAYAQVAAQFPDSPWVKESEFARKVTAWKKEMGAIQGVPPEAARFLRPGSGGEGTDPVAGEGG